MCSYDHFKRAFWLVEANQTYMVQRNDIPHILFIFINFMPQVITMELFQRIWNVRTSFGMNEDIQMYNWCKKLKQAFEEITQSYDQYAKSKGVVTYKSLKTSKIVQSKKKQSPKQDERSESTSNEIKPKNFSLSPILPPPIIKNNKQSFEYKYRIAALRKLSQKAQEEMEVNQEQEAKMAEAKKKSSAFFLFVREKRTSIRQEYPQLGIKEISKILKEVWTNMSDSQRNAYQNQNKNNKSDFDRKFKKYLEGVVRLQNKRNRSAKQGQQNQ